MNQKEMVELVQQHHPTKGVVEINKMLNRASDSFCAESEINETTLIESSVAGQRYYTLDADIVKIISVEFNDVAIPRLIGKPLIEDDEIASSDANALATPTSSSNNRYYYTDNNRLAIVEKTTNSITRDNKTSNYQSCSVAGTKNIRVYVVALALPFTEANLDTSASGPADEIPIQFHETVVYKAISDLYKTPPTLNADLSIFFENEYFKGLKNAKKYSKTHKQRGGVIVPHEF